MKLKKKLKFIVDAAEKCSKNKATVCAKDRGLQKVKNTHWQTQMHANKVKSLCQKHKIVPANGRGLKFLMNFQKSGLDEAKENLKKIVVRYICL